MRRRTGIAVALGCIVAGGAAGKAHADTRLALHLEGGAAHTVGGESARFGWGATGLVAPELRLHPVVGVELGLGAIALSDGTEDDPAYARSAAGSALVALPGLRLRPFALSSSGGAFSPDGFWIAGGGGVTRTGELVRTLAHVRVGFDITTRAFAAGPFAGFIQIVEPDGGVRSTDGRIGTIGLHLTFDPGLRPELASPVRNDRDGDGIADADDQCPNTPEDKDLFADGDGCPEPDNDLDGLADADDRCPNDPEDFDGFQDADGCPDYDNDGDGVADAADACPNDPEDFDGFQDGDGCSDLDNDSDGIADARDACPNEPETVNGVADDDGCPDGDQVRVLGDRIVLDDRVHFNVNQAAIRVVSWPLLAKLAALLSEHPEYVRVHIEGHADDMGTEEYNQKLSEERAAAVRDMLVRFGVSRDRLTTFAYGETRPREAADTPQARYRNRRVEFTILERRMTNVVRGDVEDRAGEVGAARGSLSAAVKEER